MNDRIEILSSHRNGYKETYLELRDQIIQAYENKWDAEMMAKIHFLVEAHTRAYLKSASAQFGASIYLDVAFLYLHSRMRLFSFDNQFAHQYALEWLIKAENLIKNMPFKNKDVQTLFDNCIMLGKSLSELTLSKINPLKILFRKNREKKNR